MFIFVSAVTLDHGMATCEYQVTLFESTYTYSSQCKPLIHWCQGNKLLLVYTTTCCNMYTSGVDVSCHGVMMWH